MTDDNNTVNLEFDLPAQPQSLVKLAALLREDDINLHAIGALVESDMSFAAAVMKAVNSPLYGLKGRVQSVQQAVTYLGVREISGIAYESGLQAAFPQVPQLLAVWERASVRGLLMGRLAQALSMEAWGAHTAGLFEECGKAVLYKHAPAVYAPMLAAAADDVALAELERQAFGVSHDEVGARLCEAWGLTPAAVASVRHHVSIQSTLRLPRVSHRYICVLSALAHTITNDPAQLDDVAMKLAPQAMLDQSSLLRGLHRVKDKIDEAIANG
jgi:HD-like signal output (HDOD) protein